MVQAGLRSPADVEGGSDMGACPIIHLFIVKMFYRRAGDNHTIELLLLHQLEITVESFHVLHRRILRRVPLHFHERDLDLQRRVGQQPDEVGLCRNFQRHEVQYDNAQRTDVLRRGSQRCFLSSTTRWPEACLVNLMACIIGFIVSMTTQN
mgnify:CR=1 FL=1